MSIALNCLLSGHSSSTMHTTISDGEMLHLTRYWSLARVSGSGLRHGGEPRPFPGLEEIVLNPHARRCSRGALLIGGFGFDWPCWKHCITRTGVSRVDVLHSRRVFKGIPPVRVIFLRHVFERDPFSTRSSAVNDRASHGERERNIRVKQIHVMSCPVLPTSKRTNK